MGWILDFFRWLYDVASKAVVWAVQLPAQLVIFALTFAAAFGEVVTFVISNSDRFVALSDTVATHVGEFNDMIDSSPVGNILGYCLALDVCWGYLSSLVGIFVGLVGFLFLTLFSAVLTMWVIPYTFRFVLKVLSLVTGGFVRP